MQQEVTQFNSMDYSAKGPFPTSSCTGQNVNKELLLLHHHFLPFVKADFFVQQNLRLETFVAVTVTQPVHMLRI